MPKRTQQDRRAQRRRSPAGLRRFVVAAGLTLAPFMVGVSAEMYRWVDDSGVTVYSQQPPPDGSGTRIRPEPGPSSEDARRAEARVRTLVEQDFDKREETTRQAEESRKTSEDQAARRANCQSARANLETIENLGARRLHTADGEYRYLSDAERAKLAGEARKQIKENCN